MERFTVVRLPSPAATVRQLLGRRGEVWGAESGTDKLVVVRRRSRQLRAAAQLPAQVDERPLQLEVRRQTALPLEREVELGQADGGPP